MSLNQQLYSNPAPVYRIEEVETESIPYWWNYRYAEVAKEADQTLDDDSRPYDDPVLEMYRQKRRAMIDKWKATDEIVKKSNYEDFLENIRYIENKISNRCRKLGVRKKFC